MVAGSKADPLFHQEVLIKGTDKDLSFNIVITLQPSYRPLDPPRFDDAAMPQGIYMYIHAYCDVRTTL